MPIRSQEEIDDMIDFLNSILKLDETSISKLFDVRVECDKKLAEHQSLQVRKKDEKYYIGILGILNGFFGTYDSGKFKNFGPITATISITDKHIFHFENTKNTNKL